MSYLIKYSLLSFPITSLGLGYWQIKRLEWKRRLIANLEERLSGEPIDLMQITAASDLDDLEYTRVKVRGRFDHNPDHQLFLKPRLLIANQEAILRGRTAHQSNIGVNVVTPFQVEATDLRILINRGWLALKGKDSVENSLYKGIGQQGEVLEIEGIIRKTDNRPKYGMKNDESSNEWQIRDLNAMAQRLRTAPIFLDACERTDMVEGPIGGQTQLSIRNEHLNYAITWFSLSVLSYIMWYGKYKGIFSKLR